MGNDSCNNDIQYIAIHGTNGYILCGHRQTY